MDSLTRKVVQEIGESRITLKEEIETGLNKLYRVEFEGEDSVLKIHTEKKSDQDFFHNYEGLMIEKIIKNSQVNVPEVHLVSRSADPSYMVTSYVPGKTGEELQRLEISELERLIENFGTELRKLHDSVEFETFGYLKKQDCEMTIWRNFDSWRELFCEHLKIDLEDLEGTVFEDSIIVAEEILRDENSALNSDFQPVAIHDDNRFDNLIWDGEKLHVLDWATGFNGTADFDITKAEFLMIDHNLRNRAEEEQQIFRDALYRGYGEDLRQNRELWRLNMMAHTIWTMKGFEKWSPTYEEAERNEVKENLRTKLRNIRDQSSS